MRAILSIALASVLALSGCGTSRALDPELISKEPASAALMKQAFQAARICAKLPDWPTVKAEFKAIGYQVVPGFQNATTGEVLKRSFVLKETPSFGASTNGINCGIAVAGMTPEQSVQLAAVWARAFGAVTNAEAGQGLASDVAQAWRSFDDERNVYIAAYKSWDPDIPVTAQNSHLLTQPGAAVSLSVNQK